MGAGSGLSPYSCPPLNNGFVFGFASTKLPSAIRATFKLSFAR